jgi:tetratricopeptide (TPR) repeat protein
MFAHGRNINYDHGLRCFDQGLYEQAIEILQLVLDDQDDSDPLSKRLALFYIAESYSAIGMSALQTHAYVKAKDALSKALEINPHYADLRMHYGRACQKQGEFIEAQDAYLQSLKINPKFSRARFFYGVTLYEQGKREQAIREFSVAVEQEPAFQSPIYAEALSTHAQEDFNHALLLFDQTADTKVDDISYHIKLGSDYYRRGLYQESIVELERALSLNPSYADVHNLLGIALNATGQYAKAALSFGEALKINPRYVDARTNLAITLEASGKTNEAGTEFDHLLHLDPDNIVAKERRQN